MEQLPALGAEDTLVNGAEIPMGEAGTECRVEDYLLWALRWENEAVGSVVQAQRSPHEEDVCHLKL